MSMGSLLTVLKWAYQQHVTQSHYPVKHVDPSFSISLQIFSMKKDRSKCLFSSSDGLYQSNYWIPDTRGTPFLYTVHHTWASN